MNRERLILLQLLRSRTFAGHSRLSIDHRKQRFLLSVLACSTAFLRQRLGGLLSRFDENSFAINNEDTNRSVKKILTV